MKVSGRARKLLAGWEMPSLGSLMWHPLLAVAPTARAVTAELGPPAPQCGWEGGLGLVPPSPSAHLPWAATRRTCPLRKGPCHAPTAPCLPSTAAFSRSEGSGLGGELSRIPAVHPGWTGGAMGPRGASPHFKKGDTEMHRPLGSTKCPCPGTRWGAPWLLPVPRDPHADPHCWQGSESWEVVEEPRVRGSPGQEPQRHEGYLLKKRKWPLKGWHKVTGESWHWEPSPRHLIGPGRRPHPWGDLGPWMGGCRDRSHLAP